MVKAKVYASMKNTQYNVYIHLDQLNGNAVYADATAMEGRMDVSSILLLYYTPLTISIWDPRNSHRLRLDRNILHHYMLHQVQIMCHLKHLNFIILCLREWRVFKITRGMLVKRPIKQRNHISKMHRPSNFYRRRLNCYFYRIKRKYQNHHKSRWFENCIQ